MTGKIWLNGAIIPADAARIDPADRGFLLGDGMFETLRTEGSTVLWLEDHLTRLRRAGKILGIPVKLTNAEFAEAFAALIAANAIERGALRLTISRGIGSQRGVWPPGTVEGPTMLATLAALPTAPPGATKRAIVAAVRRNEFSPLSRVKSLNYGEAILARREAEAAGAEEALLLNTVGNLVCSSAGNVFIRHEGIWLTPRVDDGILRGIARARLIPILEAHETEIDLKRLMAAEAILISNSLSLTALASLNERPLAPVSTLPLADRLYRD